MARVWRLRLRGEFERVRQNGRSWPHRFFVLIVLPQADRPEALPRIGVAAGKRLGGAVTRNRFKRKLREVVHARVSNLKHVMDDFLWAMLWRFIFQPASAANSMLCCLILVV